MSLLEDVFLEDEAGEAERLERVIEGDEYEYIQNAENSDGNSEKEDEAQEDKRHVDPTKPKRVVKNPRFTLNPARLTGPRGIQVIPDHFKDFKFKGKGHEKEDLDMVLKKLEHWAYRLYPKFEFGDCLKKIETLGKKRPVMVHLHKIRTDQFKSDEVVEQKDSSDEEPQKPEEDEFDKLLQEQIELARATPTPGSVKPVYATPLPDRSMPKVISSPSINDEQRERMLRNKRLAEERRLAKLKIQEAKATEPDAKIIDTNSKEQESPEIQMTQVTSSIKEVSKFNINESPDSSNSEDDLDNFDRSVDVTDKAIENDINTVKNDLQSKIVTNSDLIVLKESEFDSEALGVQNKIEKNNEETKHNDVDMKEDANFMQNRENSNNIETVINDSNSRNVNNVIEVEKMPNINEDNVTNENLQSNNVLNKHDVETENKGVEGNAREEIMDVDFSDDF